ncbi:MAG: rhomboid family intramembrane serine protease [Spartobacteria bacterium]
MLDLNHILLFIAVVSPLILLVRIARLKNVRNHGWRIAAVVVLAACALAWLVYPSFAGFIGGTFWGLFLLAPSLAERRIDGLLLAQHFARARRLAFVRHLLHPWNDTPYRPSLLRCLELASTGRLDRALDQLARERDEATPAGRFATALTFALTENWRGLLERCRQDRSLKENPAVFSLYLRALGETGALDDLLFEFTFQARDYEPWSKASAALDYHLALVLAFSGQTAFLVRHLAGRLRQMPAELQQFWLGTAEWAEGKREAARQRLEKLGATTRDAILRRSIEGRLVSAPGVRSLTPPQEKLVVGLVTGKSANQPLALRRHAGGTPAVWALILLNLAMFGVELISGGATNVQTLHQLGALEPDAVLLRHEYWRLLTALFLHFGALHVLFNLYALYLLGPELELIIGSFRFTISYLLAGLGSSAGVVLLYALHFTEADLLVGASGCVMGIIGVSAGLLLRHRQSPLAGRRLRNIVVIVALQTAFDLTTPQVSLAAHLSGFVTGLGIGILLSIQQDRPKPA